MCLILDTELAEEANIQGGHFSCALSWEKQGQELGEYLNESLVSPKPSGYIVKALSSITLNLTVYGVPVGILSSSFGRNIGGIIGNDIIKELVVEVDYASQVINFYEPQSYQYSGDGEIFPITIEDLLTELGPLIIRGQ